MPIKGEINANIPNCTIVLIQINKTVTHSLGHTEYIFCQSSSDVLNHEWQETNLFFQLTSFFIFPFYILSRIPTANKKTDLRFLFYTYLCPCKKTSGLLTKEYNEWSLRALALYYTVDDPSNVLESCPTRKKNWILSFYFIFSSDMP